MDRQHFCRQMKRLADTFGVRFYGDERVDIIWRDVNYLSDDWMVRTTDLFIGNHRQPPLMPEFREEIGRERERLWQIQKKDKRDTLSIVPQFTCEDCGNNGVVQCDENGAIQKYGVGYAYRCHCENGAQRTEKFPRLERPGLRRVSG